MFKDCFGFEGRIRRLEYGLTFMIFVLGINLIVVFGNFLGKFSNLFLIITIIPLAIFRVAQATKRCHDLGNSGWFQLIPFYTFWLIFADGQLSRNEYGSNPKAIKQIDISQLGKHLEDNNN
ncbi:DUF805 domain-containing protein [Emticicia sp. ODNR4P]|jgi:uncharacterized membrane protein YhaH (DUF805 family)|nr:DUF805 domain-containing protein [Emticicia sp. ODNR4P]